MCYYLEKLMNQLIEIVGWVMFMLMLNYFCWRANRAVPIRGAIQLKLIADDTSMNRQKNLECCSAILLKSSVENLSFKQRIQCSSGLAKLFSNVDRCKHKIRKVIVMKRNFILGWRFKERINSRSINIPASFYTVDRKKCGIV